MSYPPGEKMNEQEVDALMQGQEDENGCVNYEGLYWPIKLNYILWAIIVATLYVLSSSHN